MSRLLVIPQRATTPTAAQLTSFLRGQGWTLSETPSAWWATYHRTFDEEVVEIEVPLVETASDFPRSVRILLDDLARILEREPPALIRDILAEGKDLLRLQIKGPSTRGGLLSLEAGRGVYQGARDLFLAVASSVLDAKAVFPTRKPAEVMELVEQARLGLPEHGSFVLVIENPVPPALRQLSFFDEAAGDLPLARRVTMRFMEAMLSLGDALRRTQVEDDLGPFREAVGRGVSANLCEAVALILTATQADSLTTSAAHASRWPLPPNYQPRSGIIGGHTLPLLREVAKGMREEALYADTSVQGPVVKLHSDNPTLGGSFAVRAYAEGAERTVWVDVDQDDYARATNAHRDGDLVRLAGDLKRDGRWRLLHSRDLRVISLDGDAL